MGLVYLVQRPQTHAISCVRYVLAERPPYALLALDPALAGSVRTFRVDVDRVNASPSETTL
jgi:hypothetical protein